MSDSYTLHDHEELIVDYRTLKDSKTKMLRFVDMRESRKAFLALPEDAAIEPYHVNHLRACAAGHKSLPGFYDRFVCVETKTVHRCYGVTMGEGEEKDDTIVHLQPIDPDQEEQKLFKSFT